MKRNLFLLILGVAMLAASCTPKVKVVENPVIEYASDRFLDITRIEITDSATFVEIKALHPLQSVKFVKDTYLQIEGEKYVVTAAEGCQLDKWLKIPESSHASLRFTFPPIPKQAKSMDFIEGDSKDAFKLCDIDLTGRKKEMAKWHSELPQELRKEINDMDIPEPVLTNGRSKVRVHIMGFRDEMSKEITLNAQGFTAFSDNHKVNYDPQKGYAEVELNLYGSTEYFITANRLTSQFWVAPGEDIDVYVDARQEAKILSRRRQTNDDYEYLPASTYSTGIYSDWNNAFSTRNGWVRIPPYEIKKEFNSNMSADEYMAKVDNIYTSFIDSVERCEDLRPFDKRLSKSYIDLKYCELVMQAESNLYNSYKREHPEITWRDITKHYTPPTFTTEHYKALHKKINLNDATYLMHGADARLSFNRNIDKLELPNGNIYKEMIRYYWDLDQKARTLTITNEEMNEAKQFKHKLFYEVLQHTYLESQREYAEAQGKVKIEHTPNVADDKLLETIIAPHKGKVVVVDFWFVGCTGCHLDFEHYAPLKKKSELKDVVWIYVDCESPLVPYTTRIADLDGIHYRLTKEQWDAVGKKYGFSGAPTYFFVEKDGTYRKRDDLRYPNKLESALKEMINK